MGTVTATKMKGASFAAACFLLFSSAAHAQLGTTTNADGDSIVVSSDADETTTVSTITSADDDDDSGGITQPPAVGDRPTTSSGQADPTTYASYEQLPGGGQSTHWLTFSATTPSTLPPRDVPSGTVLGYSEFLASLSGEVASVEATRSGDEGSAAGHLAPLYSAWLVSVGAAVFGAMVVI